MKQDFFLSNLKLFILLIVLLCSCQKVNQQSERELSSFNGSKIYHHNDMLYLVIEGTRGMIVVNLTLDSLEKEILQKKLEKSSW